MGMTAEGRSFPPFLLDPRNERLWRGVDEIRLRRKTFAVLRYLVERPGELVTKAALLDAIWGGVSVSDSMPAISVRELRSALGDDAQRPQFIETVQGRGYRFVAAVASRAIAAALAPAPDLAALSRVSSLFVGRQRERDTLTAAGNHAASGQGQLALISGEPGIGKSRLCDELMADAQSAGRLILLGHCHQDEGVPFLPFVEMLEKFAERTSAPDTLRELLADEGSELARLLPKLRRILPDLPPPLDLTPEQARRHLFNCFCDFVVRLARHKSAMLIVEDLHWADESTLALLHFLAQRLSGAKLMLVGTYRDAETDIGPDLARTLEGLLRLRRATRLKLRGLAREEVAAMLSGMSGKALPASLVGEIYAGTDGNPFFVEELYRHLEEENRLYDSAGQLRGEFRLDETDAPPSVRLVVARRLERLTSSARRMLAITAVIGRSFSFDLLRAASASDADALLESIEEAERAGLVSSVAGSHGAAFQFSHELVRQAVIAGLSSAKCDQLHLQIAETIERTYASTLEDYWGELAFHYNHSSNSKKAVEYLSRAAEQAAHGTAYNQAVNYIHSALERLREWPDDEARNRQEIALQLSLAPAMQNTRGQGNPAAGKPYARAYELARQIDDPAQLFRVMNGLWGVTHTQAKFEIARNLARELIALADRLQHPLFQLGAHEAMGTTHMWLGEFGPAREHLEKAFHYYDPRKRRSPAFRATQDPGVDCLSFLSFTLWYLGYPDQALNASNAAMTLARKLDHAYTLGYAAVHAGIVKRWCGETAASHELMKEANEICGKHGFPFFLSLAKIYCGLAMIHPAGQGEEGLALIEQGIDLYKTTGSDINWPQVFLLLGEAHESAGRIENGLEVIDDGLAAVERTGERRDEADVHIRKGILTLKSKVSGSKAGQAGAEKHFRKAIEVARLQSAKSWELRATTSLARLLRDTGRPTEGCTMLTDVYGWFTEGFDTADLIDAKALLDELSGA